MDGIGCYVGNKINISAVMRMIYGTLTKKSTGSFYV